MLSSTLRCRPVVGHDRLSAPSGAFSTPGAWPAQSTGRPRRRRPLCRRDSPAGAGLSVDAALSTFHFLHISLPASHLYQVRLDSPAGPLLGSVAALDDGWYQASVMVAGKLHTQPFPDREKAAVWLLSTAPRMHR